jgi:hypothetical protein
VIVVEDGVEEVVPAIVVAGAGTVFVVSLFGIFSTTDVGAVAVDAVRIVLESSFDSFPSVTSVVVEETT